MDDRTVAGLGPPDLSLAGFRLWVHGYAYPEASDGWDADWLRVTAHAGASGASVRVSGVLLETVGVLRFRRGLAGMYDSLSGEAKLDSHEPNIVVRAKAVGRTGQVAVRVEVTPDHLEQGHWFEFAVDQSYLPSVIAQCDAILGRLPVRDASSRGA